MKALLENLKGLLNALDITLKFIDTCLNSSHILFISRGSAASATSVWIVTVWIVRTSTNLVKLGWIRLIIWHEDSISAALVAHWEVLYSNICDPFVILIRLYQIAIRLISDNLLSNTMSDTAPWDWRVVQGLIYNVSRNSVKRWYYILPIRFIYKFIARLCKWYHLSSRGKLRRSQNGALVTRILP